MVIAQGWSVSSNHTDNYTEQEEKMKNFMQIAGLAVTVLFLVSGCGGKDSTGYSGEKYTPTTKVIPSFQPMQVPVSCKVFSHLFVWLPAGSNGQTIAQSVEKEAKAHGADMVLIGGSRQAEDDKGLEFAYYGPDQVYKCRDKWCGWKFGYQTWSKQGDWVSLGYKEWGNSNVTFDVPLVMQAAFLRCQE
jgi:hypothetical protein